MAFDPYTDTLSIGLGHVWPAGGVPTKWCKVCECGCSTLDECWFCGAPVSYACPAPVDHSGYENEAQTALQAMSVAEAHDQDWFMPTI